MSDEQHARDASPPSERVPNSFDVQRLHARFGRPGGRGSSGAGAPAAAVAHPSPAADDDDEADGAEAEVSEEDSEEDHQESRAFSADFLRHVALARARSHGPPWDGDEEDGDEAADGEYHEELRTSAGHDGLVDDDDLALQLALLNSVTTAQPDLPLLLDEDDDAREDQGPRVAEQEVPVALQALLRSLGASEAAHLAAMLGRAQGDGGVHVEEWNEDGEEEEEESGLPEHLVELLRQDREAREAQRVAHRMESAARANLWAEQDRAYQESLAADARREAKAAAVAAAAAQAEAEAKAARVAQLDELQRITAELLAAVPSEPAESDGGACALVVDIASPSAAPSRLRRRFRLEDSVSSVYAACRMAATQAALDAANAEGAAHPVWLGETLFLVRPGGMRIVMGFPPFAQLDESDTTTLAAAGVHTRERLIARATGP
jgi:hypothetical protein